MKTAQIMKRDLNGYGISQRTSDSYFNASELIKKINEVKNTDKRIREFMDNKSVKEYMQALVNELNLSSDKGSYLVNDLCIINMGRNSNTWMHPYLFIKFAMWLSPEFEVKIIRFVYDNLVAFRNQAGDYYKEMCEVMNNKYLEYYEKKPDPLLFIKEANYLNQLVFGIGAGQRNEASEQQLDLMNRLQKANIKMIHEGKSKQERYKVLRDIATYC
jgi:hypothetical protein